jgi:hypothetical protein
MGDLNAIGDAETCSVGDAAIDGDGDDLIDGEAAAVAGAVEATGLEPHPASITAIAISIERLELMASSLRTLLAYRRPGSRARSVRGAPGGCDTSSGCR